MQQHVVADDLDSYRCDKHGQQKHAICSACEPWCAIQSELAVFDSLVVLTTRSDA